MSDEKCTHCLKDQLGKPFFWIHHGNPGPIPGYCVECAVRVMRAAWRFVELGQDRELLELRSAVRPEHTT